MLQDKYGGWLNEQIVEDFAAYAQVCFKAFGKRVQHWTTFNEPLTFVFQGYSTGTHAPGDPPAAEHWPTCTQSQKQGPGLWTACTPGTPAHWAC